MGTRTTISGSIALVLLVLGYILFLRFTGPATPEAVPSGLAALQERANLTPSAAAAARGETAPARAEGGRPEEPEAARYAPAEVPAEEGYQPRIAPRLVDIEDIKQQIYDRNIESVERIGLLDDLVQTGDADTRAFWGDGWSSVDDWKRTTNGFHLEKTDDGTLVFFPDEETSKLYSFFENVEVYRYDEGTGEFVDEVDYYGKTIRNVAKFINGDVLVMMTISGTKVDLNIYQKDSDRERR
jgi:hypothetical protein